jgi:hypothetical protein
MSTTAEKIDAQRQVNNASAPRHLIGPNELDYLYEMEVLAIRMKQVGDILASLAPTTEAAKEWQRVTADWNP